MNPIARDLIDGHLIEQYLAQLADITSHLEKRLADCESRLTSLQEQLLQRNAMTARFTLHAHQQQYQLRQQVENRVLSGCSETPQDNGSTFWAEIHSSDTQT